MPQILKVKNADTLVVQLTDPDYYGMAIYKIIKQNGQTVPGRVTQRFHARDLEDARKPRPAPARIPAPPNVGCPSCGTHPRMGYVQGVACPNCEENTMEFRKWINEGGNDVDAQR